MTTTEIKAELRSAEAALLSTQIQYKAELHRREWVPEYNAAEALVNTLLKSYRTAQSKELKAEIAAEIAADKASGRTRRPNLAMNATGTGLWEDGE